MQERRPQPGRDAVGHERGRLVEIERVEVDRARPGRALQAAAQPAQRLGRAMGDRDEHAPGGRAAGERREELERGVVGPLQVVEHDDDRSRRRQGVEELAHGAMRTEAVVRQGRVGAVAAQGREDRGELVEARDAHPGQAAPVERRELGVDRVDPGRERHLALELGGPPGEDAVPAPLRLDGELLEQPRLADPRLAADDEKAAAAGVEAPERRLDCLHLVSAPDEVLTGLHPLDPTRDQGVARCGLGVRGRILASMRRTLDPQTLGDHVDRLFRAACAMCGNRHDAEDLVQETFARVLARPRILRNDDDLGYLLRVMRNTFISRLRTAQRRPRTRELPEHAELVDLRATDHADDVVQAHDVLAHVAALPDVFRDAVVAVDVAGLSYAEAARALRTKEATITSRVHRGRAQVAQRVAGEAPEPEPQPIARPARRRVRRHLPLPALACAS